MERKRGKKEKGIVNMSESERKPCAWYVYACVWACEEQRER